MQYTVAMQIIQSRRLRTTVQCQPSWRSTLYTGLSKVSIPIVRERLTLSSIDAAHVRAELVDGLDVLILLHTVENNTAALNLQMNLSAIQHGNQRSKTHRLEGRRPHL